MTETNVSLKQESLRNIGTFLKNIGMPSSALVCEGLVTIVNLISDYREEGVALSPDILLIKEDSFFTILPCQHHILLGKEEIHEKSFQMSVKMCAPLAENGWIMYIILIDDSHFEYGIVNVSLTQMSVSLYNQVMDTPSDLASCAYIRNIGNKIVELCNISNHCTIALNLNSYDTRLEDVLIKLSEVVLINIDDEYHIKELAISYLKDMFISALNHGHGNLIAVCDNIDLIMKENHLRGGLYLNEEIDFVKLLLNNYHEHSDQSATTLNVYRQLAISMMNFDGITLFNTKGSIIGYHFIVDNRIDSTKAIVGGSRSRAFEALANINGIKACFMKSQDGNIKYFDK